MTTSQQKGDALESAVLAIEGMILRSSPNVKEKTYRIESKNNTYKSFSSLREALAGLFQSISDFVNEVIAWE